MVDFERFHKFVLWTSIEKIRVDGWELYILCQNASIHLCFRFFFSISVNKSNVYAVVVEGVLTFELTVNQMYFQWKRRVLAFELTMGWLRTFGAMLAKFVGNSRLTGN